MKTRLITPDVDTMAQRLRADRSTFLSPGVVETPAGELGYRKSALVCDPDGHAMQFVERLQ